MAQFNLDDYVDVQTRITKFWEEYPDGAIRTSLESDKDNFNTCRYRADVYKNRDSERPDASGHAFEIAGQGMANKTSHEENAETSAIGRALANMGYATSGKDRPSREEMSKVERGSQASSPTNTTPYQKSAPKSKDSDGYYNEYEKKTYYPAPCEVCGKEVPAKSVSFSTYKYSRVLCYDDQQRAESGELGDPKEDVRAQTTQEASEELDNLFKQHAG